MLAQKYEAVVNHEEIRISSQRILNLFLFRASEMWAKLCGEKNGFVNLAVPFEYYPCWPASGGPPLCGCRLGSGARHL
jgi:hypothetical protein